MEACKEDATEVLIDTVLQGEPLRAVTPAFERRLKNRLAIMALIEQEHQRFRHFMATGGLLFGVTIGAVMLLFAFADLPGVLNGGVTPPALRGIPGVMGYYDYFTASMITFWGGAAGPFALLLGFSLGVTALLTLRPGYK